ncbi:CHAT domain-containing protein [Streptomyces sp. NPDC001939]
MNVRKRQLTTVQAYLALIRMSHNTSLALAPAVVAETRLLEKELRHGDGDLEARHALGWLRFFRALALQDQRAMAENELVAAARLFVPCFIAEIGPLPEPLLTLTADAAIDEASLLMDQLRRSGDAKLISDVARLWQRIIKHLREDDPDHALCLSNYGFAMEELFERTGALASLDEAIDATRKAIEATPPDDPGRAASLQNLGNALTKRFEQIGTQEDLDEAINAHRESVATRPSTDSHLHLGLSNLSNSLQARFQHFGAPKDLDEAISLARRAVQTAPNAPDIQAVCLSALSNAVRLRFARTGALADINEAVDAACQAAQALPEDHPDQASMLNNFAIALKSRYARTGALADLNKSIDAARRGAAARFSDDPYRAASSTTLCSALQHRFKRLGTSEDLNAAVDAGRHAVDLVAHDNPSKKITLADLAGALYLRFEREGRPDDLDDAIDRSRQAVLPDDHPQRAASLSNLSLGLQLRFERNGELDDLNEAIDFAHQALRTTPEADASHAVLQANLAAVLLRRARRTGTRRHIDEAIDVGRRAVANMPHDHPNFATSSTNLGHALLLRSAAHDTDADEALAAFTSVTHSTSTTPSIRIAAARFAAELASGPTAAELLEIAVRLLPEVAPRQLGRTDQQYALGGFAGLASDAAAAALGSDGTTPSKEQQTRALQLLESGRAVLMSQALDTRSDVTGLQRIPPDLAARFIHLRNELDTPVPLDKPGSAYAGVAKTGASWQDRHSLVAEFNATVAAIRGLEGLESFLLPPEPEELIAEARYGPVVVFNVSHSRGDALLLTTDGIDHLHLPGLSESTVTANVNRFHQALSVTGDRMAGITKHVAAQETLSEVLEWLWDTAAGPVMSALGFHHSPEAGEVWPRIWWAAGGLLGLLPLHAAGHHRKGCEEERDRTVMDRVVSSYTPTVRALRHARRHGSVPSTTGPALIVAMPTTPDANPLSRVADEAKTLYARLPQPRLLMHAGTVPDVPTQAPTKANVLAQLTDCTIAHFACHGSSDPSDPSQSRLLLDDHQTDPFTVASLSTAKLDQARLAYLSACETALNTATDLIDEAIHLAAIFHLAGFRRVVGTLWEIEDTSAARIADAFYDHLTTSSGEIDTSRAAHALHQAVRRVRDELKRTPSLWAAHIHVGA